MDIAGAFQSFIEWLQGLWDSIDIKGWAESVGGTSAEAIHAAVYFGGGFAIGFLFKKYFKLLFFFLLGFILITLLLEYNNIITIDYARFNVWLGFEPTADIGSILNATFDWIKENLLVFISSVVGFLIGYKLG